MDKKCYIITFNAGYNYGAFWQAYALQQMCLNYMKTEHLLLENVQPNIKARLKKIKRDLEKRIKDIIKSCLKLSVKSNNLSHNQRKQMRCLENEYKKQFDIARKNYITFTKNSYSYKTIDHLDQDNAVFIVGSDQMWQIKFQKVRDNLSIYLLDFVNSNKKKNSYAVSFGFYDVPQEYYDIFAKSINTFNRISLREARGIEIVKELTGRESSLVLDPTLLLNRYEWGNKLGLEKAESKYILVYALRSNVLDNILDTARRISLETNLPLKIICCDNSLVVENRINASPKEFLESIFNAEYVVTDSFHGAIFSINFNKKFFVVKQVGNLAIMNTRIDSITKMLGLEDRIINGSNDLLAEIDYDRVNAILDEKRKESIEFLESILVEKEEV